MTAQPLDLTQNESVEVLLPLPDTLYDPDILITETVDPAFQQAVAGAQEDLTFVLQHRATIQEEANALSRAITGSRKTPPYQEAAGLTPAEIAQLGPTLAVGVHSITAVYSGDANNAAASSAAVTQTVSNVSLSASVNPAASGVAVVLTASLVNPGATRHCTIQRGRHRFGSTRGVKRRHCQPGGIHLIARNTRPHRGLFGRPEQSGQRFAGGAGNGFAGAH